MTKTKNLYRLPFNKNVGTRAESDPTVFSHSGHMKHSLDFGMDAGTQILAAADGVVVSTKDDSKEGGVEEKYKKGLKKYMNKVEMLHPNGEYSGYYHLKYKGVFVKKGQKVKGGQLIGLSGCTGYADSPHLHFMVWKKVKKSPGWETLKITFK